MGDAPSIFSALPAQRIWPNETMSYDRASATCMCVCVIAHTVTQVLYTSLLFAWASVWFEMCWGPRRIRKCILRSAGYNEDALFFPSLVPVMKGSERRHTHVDKK